MADESTERREIIFHGHVQGVGFRYTTRQIAERFAVTGFVRNRPDNTVQLVAEGKADEIDRFFAAVSAEMERFITHADSVSDPATGEFHGFSVRF